MKRSISSAFALVVIARVIVTLTTAITAPLLTRILGPSLYGQYAVVLAVFNLFQILITSGVNTGSKKFLSENRGVQGWRNYVWGYYAQLAALLALLFMFALSGAAYFGLVEQVYGPDYVTYFYLLAILAICVQYRDYVNQALMGLQLEKYSEPLKIVRKVSFGIIAVTLAYLGFGVEGVLTGQIVASFLVIILGLLILRREIDLSAAFRSMPSDFPRNELRSFQNLSILYIFLLTSLYHIDVLMLEQSVSDSQVGYYKAALVLAELLWLAPKALQDVMIQSVSPLWREDAVQQITDIATNSTRYILLLTLLCAIGLAALADEFVPFYYGSEYAPAVFPLLILLPGTIGFAATRPLLTITQSKGNLRPLIIATGIAAGLNLGLNALLIPRYGITGAAIATSIGYGSLLFTQVWCAKYIGYDPFQRKDLLRIGVTCLLAGPIILFAGHTLNGYKALLIVPPLGGIVFFIAAIGTSALRTNEVLKVGNRILPKRYVTSIERFLQ